LELDRKLVDCVINPLSYLAVNRPLKFQPVKKGGDWRYYMDVEGKPGWIADAVVDSPPPSESDIVSSLGSSRQISFHVTLSAVQPMMRLSYLRSYNSTMGKLTCCISGSGVAADILCPQHAHHSFEFDGHWGDQTSQGVAVAVHLANISSSKGSRVQRNLICQANQGKFKIIGVVGC
jgi:hypothetical protein